MSKEPTVKTGFSKMLEKPATGNSTPNALKEHVKKLRGKLTNEEVERVFTASYNLSEVIVNLFQELLDREKAFGGAHFAAETLRKLSDAYMASKQESGGYEVDDEC